jgi:GNAT superfamily N-acetyltransferase
VPHLQARIARIKHIIYKLTVPPDAGLTDFWELDGMYVDPRFQRQGLGRQLLQWSVEKARLENMPIVIKSSPVA